MNKIVFISEDLDNKLQTSLYQNSNWKIHAIENITTDVIKAIFSIYPEAIIFDINVNENFNFKKKIILELSQYFPLWIVSNDNIDSVKEQLAHKNVQFSNAKDLIKNILQSGLGLVGVVNFHFNPLKEVIEKLQPALIKMNWLLNIIDVGVHDEINGKHTLEVYNFNTFEQSIQMILMHQNNKHLRCYDYLYICSEPKKVEEHINTMLKYAFPYGYYTIINFKDEQIINSIINFTQKRVN